MNQKMIKPFFMLLLVSSILTSTVGATSSTFEPLIGLDEPNKYYGVYLRPDGSLRADTIRIPILSPDYGSSYAIGGLMFYNVTVDQGDLINSANLTLWFEGDTEVSASSIGMRVYGAYDAFAPGATLQGLERSNVRTSAFVDVDLTSVTSAQFVTISVTNIVQEIVNLYGWDSGYSLAFLIYGEPSSTARSFQSNIGANYPTLDVRFNEYTSDGGTGGGSPIDIYRGYTIYEIPTSFDVFFYDAGTVNLCYHNESGWTSLEVPFTDLPNNGEIMSAYVGGDLYFMGHNGTGSFYLFKMFTNNNTIVSLGALPSSSGTYSQWSLVYYAPENSIYMLYASSSAVFRTTYSLDTSTFSARFTHYSGGLSTQSSGLDMLVNDTMIYWTICMGDGGYSAGYVRIGQYDGVSWSAAYEVTDNALNEHFTSTMGYDPGEDKVVVLFKQYASSGTSQRYRGVIKTGPNYNDWSGMTAAIGPTLAGQYSSSVYDPVNGDLYFAFGTVDADQRKYIGKFDGGVISALGSTNYTGYDQQYTTRILVDNTGYFVVNVYGVALYYMPPLSLSGGTTPLYNWQLQEIETGTFTNVGGSVSYESGTPDYLYLIDENGTLIETTCLTLECVYSFIDTIEGPEPDDPSPPGWDETGSFTRGRIKLYFFVSGMAMIFLPLYFVQFSSGYERFKYIWVLMLCWVIGLGLLWSIPHI